MIVRDIGKIMQRRAERGDNPSPAYFSAMRKCVGPCKKRKSIAQFIGASELCKQCVRRQPPEAA